MVTTAPIKFKALPRLSGTVVANTPAVEVPLAKAIDADFALINPWADPAAGRTTVTRVSSILDFTGTNFTWNATVGLGCDGVIVGDLRHLHILVKYTGPTLTADPNGNVVDQTIGKLKDERFRPGTGTNQYVMFVGEVYNGLCTARIHVDGTVVLSSLSCAGMLLATNNFVDFSGAYMPVGVVGA